MRILPNLLPCLLCRHALHREVASFTEKVARQIHRTLLLHQLAHIATKATLTHDAVVAGHRCLQNIPTNDEQGVQVVGIEELPRSLAPLGEGVVAHQLVNVEELPYLVDYLLACHN